jgi:ubiquinone/menaquinone biosynthesis C-methylase UbiE
VTSFRRVLDVNCGTGDWLIEMAKTHPTISLLIGVDISQRMVEYARAQAEAQHVSDRVEFHTMDALRMLEFPNNFFDLVNERFGQSYLRTWDWPKLLEEFQRVCKPGGVIRVTEANFIAENSSPALTHLYEIVLDVFHRSGHYFRPTGDGVICQLAHLLEQHGLQNVQTRTCTLEYRAGTAQGRSFYEDQKLVFRTMLPFMHKWTRVPDDYEALYQQALNEMQQPDFVATWELLTAWGINGD